MIRTIKSSSAIFITFITLSCLISCGGTPEKTQTSSQTTRPSLTKIDKAPRVLTANDYLNRAEQAKNIQQATLWYTRAVDVWITEKNYVQAHALLLQLDPTQLSPYMQQQFALFNVEIQNGFALYEQAYPLSQQLTPALKFEQRVWHAKYLAASKTQHHLDAAKALIQLRNYLSPITKKGALKTNVNTTENSAVANETHDVGTVEQAQQMVDPLMDNGERTWYELTQLTNTALEHFNPVNDDILSGWMTLLAITRRDAHDPSLMLTNISHWQTTYPNHPAAEQLPDTLTAALNSKPYQPERVAVLLPLTGKYALQGQAVQQGILASKFAQQNTILSLTFIDSASEDIDALELDYDFIIGPLLKPNLEKITQRHPELPMIMLNQLDELKLNEHQFSFTLSPEGEAKQAATKLAELGYQHPILIVAENSYGKRIAQTFVNTFELISGVKPEVAFFKNSNEMEDTVEKLMATGDSNKRIKTMKSLFENSTKFKSEARNRQDVDLIYVHGNTTQVQLLKPFVDVNTAPFSKQVPIFSTSHGYSSDLNLADYKDLNGIKFSEIPWLLPSNQQASSLAQEMEPLWSQNNNPTKRLFAFGYDAFSLIPNLAQMRAFPNFFQKGLSGTLTVEPNGHINRQMIWAEFKNEQVTPFEPVQ